MISFPHRPHATPNKAERLNAVSGRPIGPGAASPDTLRRILTVSADQLACATCRAEAAALLREIADDLEPPQAETIATLIAAEPGSLA